MTPLVPIVLAGSALVAWLAARGKSGLATFDDFRKAFPLYLEAKAVERDKETKTSHEPLELSAITLENGGYSVWMQAGGKYRLFWWRVPSKPFDLEMNFQALRAAVNLAVTSKERETLPTVIQAGDFPPGACWLAVYADGGNAWRGIGWFYDRKVAYGYGAGLKQGIESGWEQALSAVHPSLRSGGATDGWWYIYRDDKQAATMGRAEPPRFGNVNWISRSKMLGIVNDGGALVPYPDDRIV